MLGSALFPDLNWFWIALGLTVAPLLSLDASPRRAAQRGLGVSSK
jgi:hypothetical protein